ncbi:MAG: DNA internalization-related competence protein ComEC/Rec2 [Thermodesulfovibrionales bacterium]|nr:DNA internalization-related competence protein ComEC/Rec2 [Thermodesulfovibrionales bacterium]
MSYFIFFICGAALFYIHRYFPFTSLSIFMVIAGLHLFFSTKKKFARSSFLGAASMVIIAFLGFYYANLWHKPQIPPSEIAGRSVIVEGIARSEAVQLTNGVFSQLIEVKKAEDEHGNIINLKEIKLFSNARFSNNRIFMIKAKIPAESYFLNPWGVRNRVHGYVYETIETGSRDLGFFEETRLKLNRFLKDNFTSESSAFLMSIITGERGLLKKETRDAFNSTGLAHILSISGAHFGLLFFIVFKFFRVLVKLLPYNLLARLTLYITPSQIAAVLSIPVMIGYLGISDMSFPAIRSFIMITLFLFGLVIQRRGFWLNTLLFAAVVIILIQPDSILDLSFQLSFIAVLCIGLTAEQKGGRAEEQQFKKEGATPYVEATGLLLYWSAALKFCSSALKISLAATIGTAPIVAYYFHYFSLISPLANLIITPVIGFIILPAALISSFIFLVSGIFPAHAIIDKLTAFVISAIKYIAQWGFTEVKIAAFPLILLVMFYAGILFYVFIKNRQEQSKALSVILTITVSVIPFIVYAVIRFSEHKGIQITYLDVGQGDSAVVELSDKRILVVDTGRNGFQTGEFLRYRGIKEIDAVVLSHGQSDHAGGIEQLIKNFKVNEIWDNGRQVYPEGFLKGIRHRVLQRGDVVKGNGYRIVFVHPYDGFYTLYSGNNDENNECLVFKIQGIKNTFLFTGDIEEEAESDIAHLDEKIKSSVLKVPHHGSRTSTSEIFMYAVSPEIAVISSGRRNSYGHPHEETLDKFGNIRVLRTDLDGAINIRELSDGSLKIRTWKDFQITEVKGLKQEFKNLEKLFLVW